MAWCQVSAGQARPGPAVRAGIERSGLTGRAASGPAENADPSVVEVGGVISAQVPDQDGRQRAERRVRVDLTSSSQIRDDVVDQRIDDRTAGGAQPGSLVAHQRAAQRDAFAQPDEP